MVQYLSNITSPDDVKKLNKQELEVLSEEIREFLVDSLSKTGGHLSSNLGVVELSVSLHKVFDSPKDKIIWDVGHQSYAHKILTGRRDLFDTLRKENGISGFPKHKESAHDAFLSGHSSNSISAGYGIAQALALNDDNHQVVAVIGDGSFTGGMVYEALNNAGRSKANLIVVLNHNDMSISKNVGAFSKYLSLMRAKQGYFNFKTKLEKILDHTPLIGRPIKRSLSGSKSLVKRVIYNTTFFEELGFEYMGPVNGHSIEDLTSVLEAAKREDGPVLVHVDTTKGKGYQFAEENPGAYHAVGTFDPAVRLPDDVSEGNFSDEFGKTLVELAKIDPRICAVTAAMKHATGLHYFYQQCKDRFFDVGIAEQHAVTFCAGLASQGKLPVFAVYSSFLQRGYDQLLHDCALEPQHVVLGVDRAGLVGADGETHQGIYDVAFLSSIPNVTIFSPETYAEMRHCLKQAIYQTKNIAVVRYPRGAESCHHDLISDKHQEFLADCQDRARMAVVTYGRLTDNVMQAVSELRQKGRKITVIKLVKIHPIPEAVVVFLQRFSQVFFFEEGSRQGGIGMQLLDLMMSHGYHGSYHLRAIDHPVKQAEVESSMQSLGLDTQNILACMEEVK